MSQRKHSVLLDYLHVLNRRRRVILYCLGGVMLLVALANFLTTPVYEAEATIVYAEPKDTRVALDAEQSVVSRTALINLAEQLRSRTLAKAVAQALPEPVLRELPKNPNDLEKHLQERLSVSWVPGSDIIKIIVLASDATSAKIIANTYLEQIIDWNLRKKREEITSVRDFIEEQLGVFQAKLTAAEENLRAFKEENQMLSLNEASMELLDRMTRAEIAYNEAKADRGAQEQRQRYIEKKRQELAPALTITVSPLAQELKQKLQELEKQYSAHLAQGRPENAPEMLALKQEITRHKQELNQELLQTAQKDNLIDPLSHIKTLLQEAVTLEVDLETIKAREESLRRIAGSYESELQTLPKQQLQLARLTRDREVNDRIYSMLLEKREEVRISEAGKVGDIHIIDTAEEPIAATKPKTERNLALGFFLGLVLGVGLAFFLESLDTSLKSREDVEKYVHLPVLASIPTIKDQHATDGAHKADAHAGENAHYKLFFNLNGNTRVYEAYRAMQLNFDFLNTEGNLRSVLVTSAGPREGKTLTAVNLAQAFAKSGVKTLLMDCDLRRPTIHKILGLYQEPGLTNVLTGLALPDQAIQKAENEYLHILTAGTQRPNPSDMLHTSRFRDLMAEMKNKYELIIIDSPPLIAVTDAIVLGTTVDGVCLVIKSGFTTNAAALEAKQLLQNRHTRILGTVLNDVDFDTIYSYYQGYYLTSDGRKRKLLSPTNR